MASILDLARTAYRNYEVDGLPSTSEHEPEKSEIISIFAAVYAALAAIGISGAVSVAKATRASLYADLAYPAGALAIVHSDAAAALNGVYKKAGASGSGSWSLVFQLDVAALAQLSALQSEVDAQAGQIATVAAESAASKIRLDTLLAGAPATRDTLAELSTAIDAVRDDLKGGVPATRDTLAKLSSALDSAVTTLGASISAGDAGIVGAATSAGNTLGKLEALIGATRGAVDAILAGAPSALDTFAEVSAALDAIGVALAAEADARSAADTTLDGKIENALAGLAAITDLVGQAYERPGDARRLFSSALTGPALARAPIAAGVIAVSSALGSVLRIRGEDTDPGAGYLDIARRIDFAIEQGRTYLVRAVFARSADPTDPEQNAVELRWQNLNANKAHVSNVRLGAAYAPTVAAGPVIASALIGKAGAPGDLSYTIPATALYGVPLVRVYGNGQQTDIAAIHIDDVTDDAAGGVDLGAITARVAALEAADAALAGRATAVEGRASALEAGLAAEATTRSDADTTLATRATTLEGRATALEGRATEVETRTGVVGTYDVPGMRIISVVKAAGGMCIWSAGLKDDLSRLGDMHFVARVPGVAVAVFKDPWQFTAALRTDLTRIGGSDGAEQAEAIPFASGATRALCTRVMAEQSYYDSPTGPKTCRMAAAFGDGAIELEFIFSSWRWDDDVVASAYTTRAAFEFGGALYPVTFAGADAVLIEPEQTVISDKLFVSVPVGATGYNVEERTLLSAGGRWGRHLPADLAQGDGVMAGAHARTAPADRPALAAERMFGPVAVRGRTKRVAAKPSVFVRGSSSYVDNGYAPMALAALGINAPNGSQQGRKLADWLADHEELLAQERRSGATDVMFGLGSNDLQAGATLEQMMIWTRAVLDIYATAALGVVLATQTPRVTGSFTSKDGQVLGAGADTRLAYSAALRTLSHPALRGVIDPEMALGDPTDRRYWRTDGGQARTSDGTHTTTLGTTEAATFIKPQFAAIFGLDRPLYDEFVALLGVAA
ncbi:hypothetical protein GCM10008171_33110 [Methylopila jiangsuensis]|uniref:Uncharacterized protein n=1 Tax=Methylopila jiangsuensis TaxID=586230 RepID=A0A9W6N5B1_9HYPH|nr:hypothetical protein [Methylopila jiangsuensis]MDR6284555.1 hypothetical protein [Methylopila jiangsuensis]GLK78057.1 hypothetical protein GCM10008171_33110 [Methylopila jiangsuensis]